MENNNSFVHSFLNLRKTIGFIGLLLPFVLWIGNIILFNDGLQPSISQFYHTKMRDVFVGALCAIALFLFYYKGYDGVFGHDDIVGHLAGTLALGVAFVGCPHPVHFFCAVALFLTLAYISLFRFTKSDKKKDERPTEKKVKNSIFRICGIVMLASLFIVFLQIKGVIFSNWKTAVYWGETAALIAFGISWLVKGKILSSWHLLKE